MVELLQGVLQGLVVFLAVAEGVDGEEDGVAERCGVGLVAPGDGEGCVVLGGRAHDGQSCQIGHAVGGLQCLEWCYALVVVHGQHSVEGVHHVAAEELVGRIGAKDVQAGVGKLVDRGRDHFLLLLAEVAVFGAVGIERQHGHARIAHAEVAAQGVVEQ